MRLLLVLLLVAAWVAADDDPRGEVMVLEVDGTIGPASSDYVGRSLVRAKERQVELVVIRMDTPGGLDTSMRSIIKSLLASPVPVATFVAPGGARAASAGTYILYASHVSAMAPGTNLGAATPVQLGGVPTGGEAPDESRNSDADSAKTTEAAGDAKTKKLVNDAAAYIRGLAQMRGRNAEWAERAVREGVSLSAEEALRLEVIDLMAGDIPDLLKKLEGREVEIDGGKRLLHTDGAMVIYLTPDWRSELLGIIGNPNVAYVLMLLGIYGLIYEFSNPGVFLPGVVGAICLLLAFYAFQVLPINYAGFALILLGLGLIVGEAFIPSFGALGIGGGIAFVIGSIILIDADAPGYGISMPLIFSLALVIAAATLLVVTMAIRSRQRPVVSGREEMLGAPGHATMDFEGEGMVRVHGEVWHARCDRPIRAGQRVRVAGRDGLILVVDPVQTKEE